MEECMDRRNFIAFGTAAAIAGATALTGCSSAPGEQAGGASEASGADQASNAGQNSSTQASSSAAAGDEKLPGAEMREVQVTAAGNVVNTNAADRLPEKFEGDLKDYFKGRDFVHQVGFCAPDWKQFAQNHHDLFGSGPFYHTTNTFGKLIYRGEEVDCTGLRFEACYGGWGSHSIEVVQQVGDAPTMFTEYNDMAAMGINHLHCFVEDLEQALEACEVLNIPVITVGYSDLEAALKKAQATGANEDEIRAKASKPSFMVVDMREQFGALVQLIGPSASMVHNLIIKAMVEWDGETDLFRELGA